MQLRFNMNDLFNNPRRSLLVTDSGLGGLSICADIVSNLTRRRIFRDLSVVYFNAWPMQDKGYNFLAGDAERIRVFGNAVAAMNRYAPDLILIACNTLSLVLHQGGLAAGARAPVVDIIDFGVTMIADALDQHPESTALILGTRTTVSSGAHRKRLMDRGIAGHRIAQQDCHGLAGAIERGPDSPEVRALVDQFMARAAAGIEPGTRHIHAALCCTHYGYVQEQIRQHLARYTGAAVDIVNPNTGMSDFVVMDQAGGRYPSTRLDVKVVSRVHLPPSKIDAIAAQVERVSPQTARALREYEHIPDLFDV